MGEVYWQAYKNTYGTHPNSIVYGNGETPELQEFYYDQDGIKIRSGNTDWAKEILIRHLCKITTYHFPKVSRMAM